MQLAGEDNLQDLVLISATTRDVLIGQRSSIAHGAKVFNSTIGNFVFVGFNAQVEDAILEDGVMVFHGARVSGVTIPRDRVVPPGTVITCAAQTRDLPPVMEANNEFKVEVLDVNIELASGYGQIRAVPEVGEFVVSSSPKTSWNAEPISPVLGKNVDVSREARMIGCVQLGDGSCVGKLTSIRGDEGAPILIGMGARIGERVTFHALKHQSIEIGQGLVSASGAVFHGGLTVGDRVTVEEHALVFNSTIGSHSRVGKRAVVIGVTLAENSRVPDGALVLSQIEADRYAP